MNFILSINSNVVNFEILCLFLVKNYILKNNYIFFVCVELVK